MKSHLKSPLLNHSTERTPAPVGTELRQGCLHISIAGLTEGFSSFRVTISKYDTMVGSMVDILK